ncbi:MAG: LCP family protein [Acidimicrobiia bacterium]|nr:LCP family protein [Acidimicrobiia bacterium]
MQVVPNRGVGDAGAGSLTPRRRRRRFWVVVSILLVCAALAGGWVAYGMYRIDRSIDRVPVGGLAQAPEAAPVTEPPPPEETVPAPAEYEVDPNAVAPHPDARFYLLLGSDSRAGHPFAASQGMTDRGRSDVMAVVRVLPGRPPTILSVPRDFRVRLPGESDYEKINAAYARGGPSLAVQTVTERFGIPIHHVVVLNFAGFEDVIETVDGVEVCVDTPERDSYSGLDIPAGCQTLDGPTALAYVRARHAEQLVDGTWRADPSGDFGRMRRQQAVLVAIARRLRNPENLTRLSTLADSLRGSVTVDDGFTLSEMLSLAADHQDEVDSTLVASLPGQGGRIGSLYYVSATPDTQATVDAFKSGGL